MNNTKAPVIGSFVVGGGVQEVARVRWLVAIYGADFVWRLRGVCHLQGAAARRCPMCTSDKVTNTEDTR